MDINISNLEKDRVGAVKEINERVSTITDKNHRIFELKKKNQELEKFKFVLDYKITELKRLIQPKEDEMEQLGEQITQMENELTSYRQQSAHLTLDLKKLNLKLNGMEKEITETTKEKEGVTQALKRFKTDLHETYCHLDDAKELKAHTKRLYQRHVANTFNAQSRHGAADVHKDYQRQRKFLEKSVDSLQNKLGKDLLVHKKENTRITNENIALIREINELRREISILRSAQKLKDQTKSTFLNIALSHLIFVPIKLFINPPFLCRHCARSSVGNGGDRFFTETPRYGGGIDSSARTNPGPQSANCNLPAHGSRGAAHSSAPAFSRGQFASSSPRSRGAKQPRFSARLIACGHWRCTTSGTVMSCAIALELVFYQA